MVNLTLRNKLKIMILRNRKTSFYILQVRKKSRVSHQLPLRNPLLSLNLSSVKRIRKR
jgi:hypothetical protein